MKTKSIFFFRESDLGNYGAVKQSILFYFSNKNYILHDYFFYLFFWYQLNICKLVYNNQYYPSEK